jgi:hypothetical protein
MLLDCVCEVCERTVYLLLVLTNLQQFPFPSDAETVVAGRKFEKEKEVSRLSSSFAAEASRDLYIKKPEY